jgi:hypothetical protein
MTFDVPSKPSMLDSEIDCFSRHLSKTDCYLEFGCGGSTMLAQELGVRQLISIESDKAWAAAVRDQPAIRPKVASGEYRVTWVDIGPTTVWGHPVDRQNAGRWPDYSMEVWKKLDQMPSLVLVDGRFRLSCAIQTLIHGGVDTRLAFHDFEREYYHAILEFTDVVEQVDRLCVMTRKPVIDPVRFAAAASLNLLNPE